MNPCLSEDEMAAVGFRSVGKGARISRKASFYGAARIAIGNHVRIDDFCVLSAGAGGVDLGNYIHIAVFSLIIGAGKVILDDFSNISSRVGIYSSSDDFSGAAMTNPMIPEAFTQVTSADVRIGRHVVIGSGALVMPGATLEEGVAVGALSLVKGRCEAFGIYAGVPARRIKERRRDLLEMERNFVKSPMYFNE